MSSLCVCVDNFIITKPNILVSNTGKLQNLSKSSWFAWVFFVAFALCCLKAYHHWKKFLIFYGLSRQETIEQHFVPHKLFQDGGHSYEFFLPREDKKDISVKHVFFIVCSFVFRPKLVLFLESLVSNNWKNSSQTQQVFRVHFMIKRL